MSIVEELTVIIIQINYTGTKRNTAKANGYEFWFVIKCK